MAFFSFFKAKKPKQQQLYRVRVEPVQEGEKVSDTQEIVVKDKEQEQ